MNGSEIDWVKLIGLALGGIGTALGIYNAWAAHEAMKPKLRISWLNCRQAYLTFSEWDVDQAKQRIMGSHPEGTELDPVTRNILERLPGWIGSLRERFVQADMVFHNEGGRDIIISDIQVDDWVRGRGPHGSRIDWATMSMFRVIDPGTDHEVDLTSTITIPPRRSVTRRIEIYEKHRTGPGGVGRVAFPISPPPGYLSLRVLTDSQPPLVVERIPLNQVDELSRPDWSYEPARPRLTVRSPIVVRGSLPIISSLVCRAATQREYEVVFNPAGISDTSVSGNAVWLVGQVYHTRRGESPYREQLGGIELHQLPDDNCLISLKLEGFEHLKDALEMFGWTLSWALDQFILVQGSPYL